MLTTKLECEICKKALKNKKAIQCTVCDKFSHFKCNFLNFVESQIIKNTNQDWQCISCSKNLFPFTNLNDYSFDNTAGNNTNYAVNDDKLVLKAPSNLSSLYNDLNNFAHNMNEDPDNTSNCKYYDTHDLQNLNIETNRKKSSLSLFHLNISSLPKHIDDLENLLASCKIDFDVIAISESRLNKDNISTHNLNLQNYSFDYCPTESTAGGTALYIRNTLSYISRPDLQIYKPFELESNF